MIVATESVATTHGPVRRGDLLDRRDRRSKLAAVVTGWRPPSIDDLAGRRVSTVDAAIDGRTVRRGDPIDPADADRLGVPTVAWTPPPLSTGADHD